MLCFGNSKIVVLIGNLAVLVVLFGQVSSLIAVCKVNEEYRTCGPSCPMTCDSLGTTVCCEVKCTAGCFCKDGFIRGPDQYCIPVKQCPKPGTVQFMDVNPMVPESVGVARARIVRVDGTKGVVSVRWRARDVTAVANQDYIAPGGTVVFQNGQTESFIELTVIDDTLREPSETFVIELFDPSLGLVIGEKASLTVTILDNDAKPGILEIQPPSLEVVESVGTLTLDVVRSGGTDGRVTVFWKTSDLTATAGSDYEASMAELVFEDGQSRSTINVRIVDDSVREPNEAFRLSLYGPTGGAVLGPNFVSTVTIVDNDSNPGFLKFEKDSYTVSESIGTATFTVIRTGGADGVIRVHWSTQDGTAVAGMDYVSVHNVIVFQDGEARKVITVTIIDDNVREPDEEFRLKLFDPSGGAVLASTGYVRVIIQDNDKVPGVVQSQVTDIRIFESFQKVTLTVTRSDGFDGPISVRYATADKTATKSTDYIETIGEIQFGDGQREATIVITVIDDNQREPEEQFVVQLFSPVGATLGPNRVITITIVDDDTRPGVIQFHNPTYSVHEGNGAIFLSVSRTQGQDGSVRVRYTTRDGTAMAGRDYTPVTGTLTFGDGESEVSLRIPILDDRERENTETFTVELMDPTGGAVLGPTNVASIEIIDDDARPGVIQFKERIYTVQETNSAVFLTVQRTQGLDGSVRVRYTTRDGTASAGRDYTPISGTLTFANGENEVTLRVPIIDDRDPERVESFTVELQDPTGGAVLGPNNVATVEIIDNDVRPGVIQFKQSTYTVQEGSGAVFLSITRTQSQEGVVRVRYITRDGTAQSGRDYTPVSGVLSFANGESEISLRVPILDDREQEKSETFTVELMDPSQGAILGPTTVVTVEITDDDEPQSVIQFSKRNGAVRESSKSIRILVVRRVNLKRRVTVRFRTVERTAKAGEDFQFTEGTVVFSPEESQQIISVPIIDDNKQENNELFDVILMEPSKNAVLGAPDKFTAEILDNDEDAAVISFQDTHVMVRESDQVARLVVTRTGGSGTGAVRFRTVDGTAKANRDYKPKDGVLNFNIGNSQSTIVVDIIFSPYVKPTRNFRVQIFSPSAGSVLGDKEAKVTIVEDRFHFDEPISNDTQSAGDIVIGNTTTNKHEVGSTGSPVIDGGDPKDPNVPLSDTLLPGVGDPTHLVDSVLSGVGGSSGGSLPVVGSVLSGVSGGSSLPVVGSVLSGVSGGSSLPVVGSVLSGASGGSSLPVVGSLLSGVGGSSGGSSLPVVGSLLSGVGGSSGGLPIVGSLLSGGGGSKQSLPLLGSLLSGGSASSGSSLPLLGSLLSGGSRSPSSSMISMSHVNPGNSPIVISCPKGMILNECARTCPPSCENLIGATKSSCGGSVGAIGCIRDCFCPDGLVRDSRNGNMCVRPSQCGIVCPSCFH